MNTLSSSLRIASRFVKVQVVLDVLFLARGCESIEMV